MSRVLVACEFSGRVRDAFIAAGHDAVSCDLLPSEKPGPHIQGDVLKLLYDDDGYPTTYALSVSLIVAHPPCRFLSNSGVRWLYGGKGRRRDPERWGQMIGAAEFVRMLLAAGGYSTKLAIENPIMHSYGRDWIGRGPDQIIQPWQFGTPETKATCLWLKGLPPLQSTNIVPGREPRVHYASPGPDRWKERSRTDPNIAAAMAEQWGAVLSAEKAA